ncbi:MAG: hypothetical protein F6K36_25680 [Symploca sp. SIO3C6]|nr:hypothetical protein [Symploca sp. SIO3C6]
MGRWGDGETKGLMYDRHLGNWYESGLKQLSRFRPPSPPSLGGTKLSKSPKLGGFRGQMPNS